MNKLFLPIISLLLLFSCSSTYVHQSGNVDSYYEIERIPFFSDSVKSKLTIKVFQSSDKYPAYRAAIIYDYLVNP